MPSCSGVIPSLTDSSAANSPDWNTSASFPVIEGPTVHPPSPNSDKNPNTVGVAAKRNAAILSADGHIIETERPQSAQKASETAALGESAAEK